MLLLLLNQYQIVSMQYEASGTFVSPGFEKLLLPLCTHSDTVSGVIHQPVLLCVTCAELQIYHFFLSLV